MMKNRDSQKFNLQNFWANKNKKVQPKALKFSQEELIELSYLEPRKSLPLVVKPKLKDFDLQNWLKNNSEFIETNLLKYGGILFRGFNINNKVNFEQVVNSICPSLMPYIEASTPRTKLSEKVYTSTEFPPHQVIALHNELSYALNPPMKIWFFCEQPANGGGETPIADVRKVFQHIKPEIREDFIQKGWMLVRNFGDGFGLPWQRTFDTIDKTVVEEYCRNNKISFEWKDSNRLRTCQVRSAVVKHPKTNDMLWFNHIIFWHISSLEPKLHETLLAEFKQEDLPYNTYYGDGSQIEDFVIDEIRKAYRQEMVIFPWQKGDILMLDNMLVAHGRNPFSGSRKILTAMGNPFIRSF